MHYTRTSAHDPKLLLQQVCLASHPSSLPTRSDVRKEDRQVRQGAEARPQSPAALLGPHTAPVADCLGLVPRGPQPAEQQQREGDQWQGEVGGQRDVGDGFVQRLNCLFGRVWVCVWGGGRGCWMSWAWSVSELVNQSVSQ
jgi:hypothetical protein